jgi:hypothetical protein
MSLYMSHSISHDDNYSFGLKYCKAGNGVHTFESMWHVLVNIQSDGAIHTAVHANSGNLLIVT